VSTKLGYFGFCECLVCERFKQSLKTLHSFLFSLNYSSIDFPALDNWPVWPSSAKQSILGNDLMNNLRKLSFVMFVLALVSACDSGDINITPSTTDASSDNSVNNSNNTTTTPTTTTNPCASYQNSGGQTIQGAVSGDNCTYPATFVDVGNEITTDITIPALANGGAHIFAGSLIIGRSCDSNACLTAAGITQGGDGPQLTIEAGATLAFATNAQYVAVHRGSQIVAIGTAASPITFTSQSDVNGTLPSFDAVQQWGGMLIAGFGIDNDCAYTGTVGTNLALTGECHVPAEGLTGNDEVRYGGINNADNSGRLEFVRVKHTGNQIGAGNELNGITFGGVGSNTTINNLQVYSTFDDGIELFGGAVNITNFVALYARDDSIDIDSGYRGTISNALVIQSENDANRCIEADGIDGFSGRGPGVPEDLIARGLNSQPTISNLTCILSADTGANNTHDPSQGWRLREGISPTIRNSMILGTFEAPEDPTEDNWCVRFDNYDLVQTTASISGVIFACHDRIDERNGFTEAVASVGNQFAADSGNLAVSATAVSDTGLVVLEGTPPVASIADATKIVNGAATTASTTAGEVIGTTFTNATLGWTFGILDGSRSQALWFENL
jgi:hypothetical protein